MRSASAIALSTLAVALAVVGAGPVDPSAARTSAVTCAAVGTPNIGDGDDAFLGVSATSRVNAWAVGYHDSAVGFQRTTLIEHWNGRSWQVQPSPSPGDNARLVGVAGTSPTNAWAVGYTSASPLAGPNRPLVEHWNGSSWQIESGPNVGLGELYGITATSATNAWAVGSDVLGEVVERWNGKAWKVQPSAQRGIGALIGVTATSSRNAWAVGYGDAGARTLIEHWDGRHWKAQRSPAPPMPPAGNGTGQGVELTAVAAASPRNAWAVGYTSTAIDDSGDLRAQSVIEHWNGKGWRLQPSPDTSTTNVLLGVAATSSHDAWAVGQPYGIGQAAIEHWNGRGWHSRPTPNSELAGVTATSANNAWAVGTDGMNAMAVHCV